jgi:multicomponent Na+:H+ antiporter subunit D
MDDLSPVVAVSIPAIGAFLIGATGRAKNVREAATLLTAVALFWYVTRLYPIAVAGMGEVWQLVEVVPGLALEFQVEPLGMIYALIGSGLWILNSIYSIGYMRANDEKHQTRFYICFALSIMSVMGLAFSANLLTMFVFYEALSLVTYPLVTHKAPATEAVRSGRTYLGILVGTSVCLFLPAIIATWVYTGTLAFTPGGVFGPALAENRLSPAVYGLIFAMFMYGIGKAALMPAHRWLPAAMVAPTPVSALLHAVAVVKAGVFAVTKVTVYVIGIDTMRELGQADWLIVAAGFTVLCASFIALFQDNLKRRLAYSTVSQLSYVVLGAALLSPISIAAAALHIAAHAFGKITLFFAAGAIYTAAHKTLVSELDGIGRRMPWTMGAFAVGTLSMIGLPPTAGFVSKWYLLSGAWTAAEWFAVVVLVLSTILNASYFLPIVYRAFFKAPPEDAHGHRHGHGHGDHGEAPMPILIAQTATATLAVSMFLSPDVFFQLAYTLMELT